MLENHVILLKNTPKCSLGRFIIQVYLFHYVNKQAIERKFISFHVASEVQETSVYMNRLGSVKIEYSRIRVCKKKEPPHRMGKSGRLSFLPPGVAVASVCHDLQALKYFSVTGGME